MRVYSAILFLLCVGGIPVESTFWPVQDEEPPVICEPGKHLYQNRLYENKPNGCGSGGFQLPYFPQDLVSCCDQHDICYGTCHRSPARLDCDRGFIDCWSRKCGGLLYCFLILAKYKVVRKLGKGFYDKAQQDACVCH